MLWEDFLLSTVRPYPADWIVDGGWGCINYLIRLDEGCVPFCVLGQNGGLKVEGDDEEQYAKPDDGGSFEAGEGELEPEGLPDAEESLGDDDEEDDTELGRLGKQLSHVRRLNLPVRWKR
jgi:hypothetical protein